ncbi:Os01g0890600 [Oryza sativa Japonica Group]|uniref:Receptor-like serine/threonine-protein kinase n=1 Tax=Oryza sativa subsp. japonica TaxID=39947 RepID=Q0JH14_ORYSJ|nr:Os01g0890600 [Oryza sativa Japonica Group]|eukprot:NP_001045050.1 Os01g0890600 [Oryza sativa Japonica Group]
METCSCWPSSSSVQFQLRLLVVALFLCLHGRALHATDTLTVSRPLTGDQKLVSERGKFALGFFQPKAGGSTGKWYVGIWYNKISVQTVVWVVNREKPVSDPSSSSLSILDDGNIILSHSNSTVWSTNSTNTGSSPMVAVLLDTGNLVIRQESNASSVLWQSFDDITDTWLPDDRVLSRHAIGVSGQTQSLVWVESAQAWVLYFSQPKANCGVYGLCGVNSKCSGSALSSCSCLKGFSIRDPNSWNLGDQTAGCRRNVMLQCGSKSSAGGQQDRFYTIGSVKLPDKSQSIEATSIHSCKLACLSNCSCTAYSYNGTCSLWHSELMNLQDSTDGTMDSIYIRLAASELPNSRTKKWWIIGIIAGGFATLGLVVIVFYSLHGRRRISSMNHTDGSLITFKYSDLQILTKNFSERLGVGSFGSVFKGALPDTTAMAVKKLEGVRQGEKQFRAEVSTIGTIHHINLIQLLGFCSEGAKRLLVYEYMPNGSLDHHLFGSTGVSLSWSTRYQIAAGIAKGLAYLHEKCRDCIIHCDIKPQNILLDSSFTPKVADFGMAKLLGRDFSRVLTSMRGTIGYLAPEWISGEAITTKADVFSYGMMLFEIISGKRNGMHGGSFFPVLVARELVEGELHKLFGSESSDDMNLGELDRACKVACWCVQDSESSRPTMGEIVQILEGLVDVEMPPVPRYLQVLGQDSSNFYLSRKSFSGGEDCSVWLEAV